VVMICACVHCRMKFAVAVVCLLMLNILISVCGYGTPSHTCNVHCRIAPPNKRSILISFPYSN